MTPASRSTSSVCSPSAGTPRSGPGPCPSTISGWRRNAREPLDLREQAPRGQVRVREHLGGSVDGGDREPGEDVLPVGEVVVGGEAAGEAPAQRVPARDALGTGEVGEVGRSSAAHRARQKWSSNAIDSDSHRPSAVAKTP